MQSDITTLSREEILELYFQHERIVAEQQHRIIEQESCIVEKEHRIVALVNTLAEVHDNLTERNADITGLNARVSEQQQLIEKLQRMLFGTKRERFNLPDGQQVMSFFADASLVTPEVKEQLETITYERKRAAKKHPGRMPLPEHLPVVEIFLEPTEDVSHLTCVGSEETKELVFVPGYFFVRCYTRLKYVLPEDDKLAQRFLIAPMPQRPIPKCIASSELLTQMILDKHLWHLPIYRQVQRFRQLGVTIPTSTADDWQRRTALLLQPLYVLLGSLVPKVSYLQVDETPIPVLDRAKKGTTHRGYLWVYHAPLEQLLYFDYRRGRGQIDCRQMLSDYRGYLQTDGYAAYHLHKARADVVALACWAHARRKFHESLTNDPARAGTALQMIGLLYDVERTAREGNLTSEERKELRLDRSLPLLNALGKWLVEQRTAVLPRSPIGKAIAYTITLWDELQAYLLDGNLEIDNNLVENAIRPVALGRKNYLFAGSHNGATNIAMYQSFLGSCQLNEIDPRRWLEYVLNHIGGTPEAELPRLLPHAIDRTLLV